MLNTNNLLGRSPEEHFLEMKAVAKRNSNVKKWALTGYVSSPKETGDRLSDAELDGLRQLAACRTDMVNFANALHGLSDNEKVKLFRHQPTMLDWYEKVAYVTNRVTDFLQSAQTANSYPAGTTNENAKED